MVQKAVGVPLVWTTLYRLLPNVNIVRVTRTTTDNIHGAVNNANITHVDSFTRWAKNAVFFATT